MNELGVVTTWQYNDKGWLLQQTEAQGTEQERTSTLEYDQWGQATKHTLGTGPEAIITQYSYDEYGRQSSVTDAEGNATTYSYDAVGNPISRTDPLGRTSTYTYNSRNQVIEQTSAMGYKSSAEYDARGQTTKVTDPLGNYSTSTYDKHGRVKAQTDAEGNTTRYEYSQWGDLIKATSAEGVESSISYDEQGRPKTQSDASGNITRYEYGAYESPNANLLISITYPGNLKTINQYDQRGRRTVSTQKAGGAGDGGAELKTISTYDAAGRTVAITSPGGKTTQTAYDNLDRIIKTTDPDNHTTSYQYDIQDNQTKVTDANQNEHQFQYDKLGRFTEETRPEGGKTKYEYDAASQLTKRTNPDGDIITYSYDKDGRRTAESKTSHTGKAHLSQSVSYQYNAANQLTGYEQKDGAGTSISKASYTLDKLGRTREEDISYAEGANQITTSISQSWNKDGQKTSQTYPDGQTATFTYDKGLLKEASQPATADKTSVTSYQWMMPKTIQYPGASRTLDYDGFYRPKNIHVQTSSQQNILKLGHQYDKDSNITQIQKQLGADINGATDYGYDNLDRLTQVTPSQTLLDLGLPNEQYSYDAVHNRMSSAHQPGEWKYETGNRLSQWGYEQSQINYGYSQSGHIQTETHASKVRSYEYDATERLTAVKDDEQTIATYKYDPMNRRISKTTGSGATQKTIYFIYSSEGLLAEINQAKQQTKSYGWAPNSAWGTALLWQADHTQTPKTSTYHYLHLDHLGTPQIATDRTGAKTWEQVSESFGNTTVSSNSATEVNMRFPGQYWDEETNTHYNYHRDYNPLTGRYVQSDPIGLDGGINSFGYALQNPNYYYDNNASYAIPVPHILIGMVLVVTYVAIKDDCENLLIAIYTWITKTSAGRWHCTAKCNIQIYDSSFGVNVPGTMNGSGSGKTESDACAAAKKSVQPPIGSYKRHCRCKCRKV